MEDEENYDEPGYCATCGHYQPDQTCAAFPGGIPMGFVAGDVIHTEVLQGQAGDTVWTQRVRPEVA